MTGLSHAQELVTLPVRDGASQSFLLLVPRDAQPVAAVVLFPGGPGSIRLRSEGGEIKFGQGNFLVRSRGLFSDRGLATVVMDAPSDQSGGMDDAFRLGDKHAADIAAVVADVKKRFPNIPVYLVGTEPRNDLRRKRRTGAGQRRGGRHTDIDALFRAIALRQRSRRV